MHMSVRVRIATTLLVTSFAAACGSDSTGPSQTPASVAQHFDSLYVEAADRGDTSVAFSGRAFLLTLLELPPALGASPSSITVTTASGVEHWKAFEFVEQVSPTDSGFALLAYRESAAHTVILIEYDGDGTSSNGALITNDTLAAHITDGSGTTTLTSTSSTCGVPPSSLTNPDIVSTDFASCKLAKFLTSLTLSTQTAANIDPALASIDIDAATINGIHIVDNAQAATLRRLRTALHTARMHERF
jgi:hypothetical protein